MHKPHLNTALLLIIFTALLIRSVNPAFGSPTLYTIPDEVPNYLAAFEMLANKTFVTSSQYPPLGSYILLPFYGLTYFFMRFTNQVSSMSQFELYLLTHEGFMLFIPRIMSAIFGTASLVVIYKLTRLICSNKNVAIWSTFLTAFSVTHVQLSHIGKPWMESQFFYFLAIYYFVKSIYHKFSFVSHIITGSLFLIVALGFHFSAIYGLIFLSLLLLLNKDKIRPYYSTYLSVLATACLPTIGLITYQKIFMSYQYQTSEFTNILAANISQGILKSVGFYTQEFIFTEPVILACMFFSIFYIKRWPQIFNAFIIYSVIYFLIISLTFYQSLRYLLPIFPLLAIPAGFFINEVLKRLKPNLKQVLTLLIIFITALPSLIWLQRYLQRPTFVDSQYWINRNIPNSTPLAFTAVRFSPFVPNQQAIDLIHTFKPLAWSKLAKYNSDLYPETVRNVIYMELVTNVNEIQSIRNFMMLHNIRFLTQVYWDPGKRFYTTDNNNWRLAAHFTPRESSQTPVLTNLIHGSANIIELLQVKKLGPYIDVIELKED